MFVLVVADMLFFQFAIKETKNNPMSDHMPGKEESWCERKKPTTQESQFLRSDLEANEKMDPWFSHLLQYFHTGIR